MDIEADTNNKNKSISKSSGDYLNKRWKNIESYSIIVLLLLIAAIIFLSLNFRLLSGIMIISGTCIGLVITRKVSSFNRSYKDSLKEFSSLNEKRDDVIIDFSHKIREPLNNLVIITELLLESGLQSKQKELLETFIASTNNMVTTVNELSVDSAGNMSYESRKPIRFNLISTVKNTIELYRLKDEDNIDFILEQKLSGDFECFGDPIIIKQIFLDIFNTVENHVSDRALKVLITLKKEKETVSEKIISFRIQIDQRIVVIDEKSNDQILAARLISSAKGTFNQEFGANSTILSIALPFVNTVFQTRQKIASSKIEELVLKEKPAKELKDLKILLVEDNLINQKITLLTLSPLVNSIDTASNGKEALDKFGTANYDLILMDIQMPVMSGLVASEKIRELESTTNSHVPIIAITANAMIGDKEKCLSAGIDDYISKPFQPSVLIEKIKSII